MKLSVLTKDQKCPEIQFTSNERGLITGGVFVAPKVQRTIRWTIEFPDELFDSRITAF